MARFCSADGADSAALGPTLSGDSPSSGLSLPLTFSLLLLPAHANMNTFRLRSALDYSQFQSKSFTHHISMSVYRVEKAVTLCARLDLGCEQPKAQRACIGHLCIDCMLKGGVLGITSQAAKQQSGGRALTVAGV